jgi:hypothetical protein
MTPEPFVSAEKAADFLDISRRYLLSLARKGIAGAYPLDGQAKRKVWVFRLSDLAAAIAKNADPETGNMRYDPAQPSVLAHERR